MRTDARASDVVVTKTDARRSIPEAGLIGIVGAFNEKLFLAEHFMEKGWTGAAHSHPHEQICLGDLGPSSNSLREQKL